MDDQQLARKPRVLCLHGFRTSGKIFEEQTQVWPEFVREKMDLVFVDAPFPAEGGLEELGVAEELFDPPLYEWFQANKDFSEYRNFDECIAFVEDCMTRIGPFDGLMGFSQGAFLAAALPGMQAEGVALTSVPKIKFVMLIAGGKFGGSNFSSPKLAQNAFSSPVECPSLHFLGEKDFGLTNGIELLDSFVDPVVINHPEGHVVPKLATEKNKMEQQQPVRKPRVLCLHAFRTSGKIFEKQTEVWPQFVREKMDLVFIDAPFPAEGRSGVQGTFDPPYYEWFQFNQGVALTGAPMIKFVMLMSGSKFGGSMFSSPRLAKNAFSSPIQCPSLHFLGEKDGAKPNGIELLDSFVDPLLIHHPEGHVVPKLDEKGSEIMLELLEKVQKLL
ncbi:hypothetical protein RHSIM_Rhsim10G0171200 [Rhododendron simsii]|uniref:Serine hydrolase domain-containing protein n=1 Tax=Rhododendron simsii TaxID=118357 RepID=A0A834LCH7_RHOSS|nr:hypothetical protein RHSIM_Rhsim10G0171200 [Rhododendron simsii]